MPLTLEIDVPEPRVTRDRLVAAMEGRTADLLASDEGVWTDPVTETVFLRPYPTLDAWPYTTSGGYARLTKASYTLITSSAWVENHIEAAGNVYLESLGVNEIVTTTATYAANRAFYVEGYSFAKTVRQLVVFECGWGDPATGVSLRLRGSGEVEIWKGGDYLTTYSPHAGDSAFTKAKKGRAGNAASVNGQFWSMLMIPCRLRELLVVIDGHGGAGGFSHVFEDLDPQAAGQTITPAGHFWWTVPTRPDGEYQKASILCAPVQFATSGRVRGQRVGLRHAPATGTTFASLVGGSVPAGCTLTPRLDDADTLAAFVPNGSRRWVRAGVLLEGPGDKSPEVYALDHYSDPVVQDTTDGTFDLTPYVERIDLVVPERGGSTITISALAPGAMEAAGLDRPRIQGGRPVCLALDDIDLFRGTLDPPDITEGADMAPCDWDTTITWKGMDRFYNMGRRKFLHTLGLDGLTLTEAEADLLSCAGYGSGDVDITVDTFKLPFSPAVSQGDWQLMPRLADPVSAWHDLLRDNFARTWVEGWAPSLTGYKWRFRRPNTFSSTPALSLYMSLEDAALAGIDPEWRLRRLVEGMRKRPMPSEGNRVMVVGWERRTETEIYSIADDLDAQNPAIAIASRPPHWSGDVDMIALVDGDGINDQDTADRARDIIGERAIPILDRYEIDCQWLQRQSDDLSLWKGDVIRLWEPSPDGVTAPSEWADLRIVAIPKATFEFDADDSAPIASRPTTYLVEVIDASEGATIITAPVAPTLTVVS